MRAARGQPALSPQPGSFRGARPPSSSARPPDARRRRRRTDQLLESAARGSLEGVERWLKAGADADAGAEYHDCWAGLHYAAQRGDAPVTEALLRHGASVDAVTRRGRGCLHLAAQEGREKHCKVIEVLLENGALPNIQTPWGATPLQDAAYLGQVAVIKLLLAGGGLVHIEDQDGRNAWEAALSEREEKALEVIKDHVGKRINAHGKLALAAGGHARLGADSALNLLPRELLAMVCARVSKNHAATRVHRYLKQTERARVRALLQDQVTTGGASGGAAAAAASLLPVTVPVTPLNEGGLKRKRESELFTGSPPRAASRGRQAGGPWGQDPTEAREEEAAAAAAAVPSLGTAVVPGSAFTPVEPAEQSAGSSSSSSLCWCLPGRRCPNCLGHSTAAGGMGRGAGGPP